jgi:hypothetical protein
MDKMNEARFVNVKHYNKFALQSVLPRGFRAIIDRPVLQHL